MSDINEALKIRKPREAARIIGVTPETLARWRAESRGPRFTRSGKYVSYTDKSIREWLESGGDHDLQVVGR